MSLTYPQYPLTNVPDGKDNIINFMDVTPTEQPYVDQYQALCNAKDFVAAKALYDSRPNLKYMIPTAEMLNTIQQRNAALTDLFIDDFEKYIMLAWQDMGTWSQYVTYAKFNVVEYEVNSVKLTFVACPKDKTIVVVPVGTLPTDTNYWKQISIEGKQGVGIGLTPSGVWDSTKVYVLNSMVSHKNALWGSTGTNTNSEPSNTNNDWSFVMALTSDANEIKDETNGATFEMVMINGVPYMREVVAGTTTYLSSITDEITGTIYKFVIIQGKLYFREVG